MTPPPAAPYSAIQRMPRLIRTLAMAVLLSAVSTFIGYAIAISRATPDKGAAAQLDKAIRALGEKADSLQDELNAKKTLQDELEAERARKPRVIIKEPGVLVIQATAMHALEPARTITVPVEVSDALQSERDINEVLRDRVSLYAEQVKTLRTQGDSLRRAVDIARRAQRGPLLSAGIGGGKDLNGAWTAKVDGSLRAGRTWSLNVELTKPLMPASDTRGLVYVRWQFAAWPR